MPPVAALAAAIIPSVAPLVVPALVGAGVGAVVAETTGGKWEKGAMYGAGGGAALGGISALGGVAAPGAGVTASGLAYIPDVALPAMLQPAIPAAAGLGAITKAVGAGAGIYGQLAQIEATKEMTEAQKILAQTKLMEAEALKIYAAGPSAIPTLAAGTSQPVYVTPAAAPAGMPNFVLYAALAFVALLLLRKK